jgi:hypothetical protein
MIYCEKAMKKASNWAIYTIYPQSNWLTGNLGVDIVYGEIRIPRGREGVVGSVPDMSEEED